MTIAVNVLIALGALIGLTLGALGAGGSMLAVPALVHVAGLAAPNATATALVAVGSAAGVGALGHRRHARLDVATSFMSTGIVGAIVGARLGRQFDDNVLLLAFSGLMMVAAYRMHVGQTPRPCARSGDNSTHTIVEPKPTYPGADPSRLSRYVVVAVAGFVVGVLTGLFGVGGGFVIVPALTTAVGVTMPEAIATSLVIVAANAVLALWIRGVDSVSWTIAATLTVPMLAGSIAGASLGRRLDPRHARTTFVALLVVAAAANAVLVAA